MMFRFLTAVMLSAAFVVLMWTRTPPTDHCAPYVAVTIFHGHIVREYPTDLYAVCGGGVHDGGYAVIGVDRG